jgi:uncharacterized protein YbcI
LLEETAENVRNENPSETMRALNELILKFVGRKTKRLVSTVEAAFDKSPCVFVIGITR